MTKGWTKSDWRAKPRIQMPDYADQAALNAVEAQLAKVRARLASMQALEKQLVALQARCDADHAHHGCGILEELVAAAHGEACACHNTGSGMATALPPVSRGIDWHACAIRVRSPSLTASTTTQVPLFDGAMDFTELSSALTFMPTQFRRKRLPSGPTR